MAETLKHPLQQIEVDSPKATVCVTGGSGYIAAHVIARLLAAGHTVHATVRDPDKAGSVDFLKALPGADARLKLFKADLLEEMAFDAAVAGCHYVIHTASPYIMGVPKGQEMEKLITPAVKGTENVLGSVERTPSVQRVVLTSSVAAVFFDPQERGVGHKITDQDWLEQDLTTSEPYYESKKRAELRAWEVAKQQSRWSLVTINPSMVYGPPLSTRLDGESVGFMANLLNGKMWPAKPPMGVGMVDVRDVAAAHCIAMVSPKAQGRYLMAATSGLMGDLVVPPLHEKYGNKLKLPFFNAPKLLLLTLGPLLGISRAMVRALANKVPDIDQDKIKSDLDFTFIDPKDTIVDMAEAMIAKGMVNVKP